MLVEKDFYSTDEWNLLIPEKQVFSKAEFILCLTKSKNILNLERDMLLLEQTEDQVLLSVADAQPLTKRRSKIKREAKDKKTSLNQEQTVLLFYYLQQQKVFLRDEYLSDKDAAAAFEILTGYSENALRQNIGRFNLWITPPNLSELEGVLKRMKIAMELEFKRY